MTTFYIYSVHCIHLLLYKVTWCKRHKLLHLIDTTQLFCVESVTYHKMTVSIGSRHLPIQVSLSVHVIVTAWKFFCIIIVLKLRRHWINTTILSGPWTFDASGGNGGVGWHWWWASAWWLGDQPKVWNPFWLTAILSSVPVELKHKPTHLIVLVWCNGPFPLCISYTVHKTLTVFPCFSWTQCFLVWVQYHQFSHLSFWPSRSELAR